MRAALWYAAALVIALAGQARAYQADPILSTASRAAPPDRVFREPDDGVRPLTRLIDKAQRSIFVETYILTDTRILRALERASAQGVDVRVMLEPRPLGMGTQPQRVMRILKAAAIRVRWAPARFPLAHAKFIVLDDRTALISTANLSHTAFTSNREFIVVDRRGTEVRALSNLFRRDWDRIPDRDTPGRLVFSPLNARQTIDSLIAGARHTLDIYGEEMQDLRVARLLVSAERRGVRVRLLLPEGYRSAAEARVVRGGIALCRPRSPYIHAKVVIADRRRAYVGSTNLSEQSLDRNREVGLLVTGSDLTPLERSFGADWCR